MVNDIELNMAKYGRHEHCRGCRRTCVTYAAPDSIVECNQRPGLLFDDYLQRHS